MREFETKAGRAKLPMVTVRSAPKVVAAASMSYATVWNSSNGNLVYEFSTSGLGLSLRTIGGTTLVTTENSTNMNVWDLSTGKTVACVEGVQTIASMAFSNGSIFTANDGPYHPTTTYY